MTAGAGVTRVLLRHYLGTPVTRAMRPMDVNTLYRLTI